MQIARKFLVISFFILAIISFVFSFLSFNDYIIAGKYYYSEYEYYGADAYTGIQHSATDTSLNIYAMRNSISSLFGFAFILIGLVFMVLCIYHILLHKSEDQASNNLELAKEQNQLLVEIKASIDKLSVN